MKLRLGLVAAGIAAAVTIPTAAACSPPAGQHCIDTGRTVWLSERPDHNRFASFRVGSYICVSNASNTINSSSPYIHYNKMGWAQFTLNNGEDKAGNDWQSPSTVEYEGSAYAQVCATKYIKVCSFMDHVHIKLAYTVAPYIGPHGTVRIWTDRGDISVWNTR